MIDWPSAEGTNVIRILSDEFDELVGKMVTFLGSKRLVMNDVNKNEAVVGEPPIAVISKFSRWKLVENTERFRRVQNKPKPKAGKSSTSTTHLLF